MCKLTCAGATGARWPQPVDKGRNDGGAPLVRHYVEVVTGQGGVLRRELPLWLNLPELRGLVLAAAHPHATNPGAVRLLLRRVR